LGISKCGDGYLRALLIHGARAVIHHVRRRLRAGQPAGHAWLAQLLGRCHVNKAAVALANKTARIAWAVLTRQQTYRQVQPA
jgi:transposase